MVAEAVVTAEVEAAMVEAGVDMAEAVVVEVTA